MRIHIQCDAILIALGRLKAVLAVRSTLPVLSMVKMEAGDGELVMTATDLDSTLSIRVACDVEKKGAALVSGARLAVALAKAGCEDATLEHKASELSVSAGSKRMTLRTLSVKDFPESAVVKGDGEKFTGGVLGGMLARVLPFTSKDETRYAICGVRLANTPDGLQAVATDGRRLLVMTAPGVKMTEDCTVPADAAKVISTMDIGADLSVVVSGNTLSVSCDGWTFVAKLIERDYPRWAQVIPDAAGCKKRVTVPREPLRNAIPFVEAVDDKKTQCVKLSGQKKSLTICCVNPEIGEASAELDASFAGGAFAVAFNPKYLAEMLDAMREPMVTLAMADNGSPTLVEEPCLRGVLMPMRVGMEEPPSSQDANEEEGAK